MENKKGNKNLLIVGGIILVIIVLVIILFMTSGSDKEDNSNKVENNNSNNTENNNNENNNENNSNENSNSNNNSNNTPSNMRNVTIGDLSFSITKEFKNSSENSDVYQMYNYMVDNDFCMITVNKKEVNGNIIPKNYFKSYMNLADNNLNDIKTEKINNITWNKVVVKGYGDITDYYYVYMNKNTAYDIHFMIYSGKDKCDKFFNDIKSTLKVK